MRTEISQAKRENSHYLENVSKGKEIKAIVGRKRKKGEEVSAVCGPAVSCEPLFPPCSSKLIGHSAPSNRED